jgi:hypothetical protein
MSCLGNNYNPTTTRVWQRRENNCVYETNNVKTELEEKQKINKANVLQYKNNSSNLTKNQKYALMAKGKWNYKKTYATQSETNSISNTQHLLSNVNTLNCKVTIINGKSYVAPNKQLLYPSDASNVPGQSLLQSYPKIKSYYPRNKTTNNNSTSGFPDGYKIPSYENDNK